MLDRLPSHHCGVRPGGETELHGVPHDLMPPARDAAEFGGRALRSQSGLRAGRGPVIAKDQALLDAGKPEQRFFSRQTAIHIAVFLIEEVALVEATSALLPEISVLGTSGTMPARSASRFSSLL